MIDLRQSPFVFQKESVSDIRDDLVKILPGHMQVTLKNSKRPQIRIRGGFWRGISLVIDDSNKPFHLSEINYFIPGFLANAIVFVSSMLLFSTIITVAVSIASGEFVPVGVYGGIVGVMFWSLIERGMIARIKKAWSPTLHPMIEKLKA